jgi:hypothetical protein
MKQGLPVEEVCPNDRLQLVLPQRQQLRPLTTMTILRRMILVQEVVRSVLLKLQ